MSWVKIDDLAPDHRKIIAAGAEAAWLWVCVLAYCNRQKARDGFIPEPKIGTLYHFKADPRRLATKLVDVGLLERADGGYRVHDYHAFQPSEDVRAKRSEAGKQGGFRSGEARRSKPETKLEANAKQSASFAGSKTEAPASNPVPDPDPDPKEIPLSPEANQTKPAPDPMAAEELACAYADGVFARTGLRQPKPNRFEAQTIREFVISLGIGGDGIKAGTVRTAFVRDTAGEYAEAHRGRVFKPEAFLRWLASGKPDPNLPPWENAKAATARDHAPARPAIAVVATEPPLSPEETVRHASAFADALRVLDGAADAQSGIHATVRKSEPPTANAEPDDAEVSA